jgi:hypothetical protein
LGDAIFLVHSEWAAVGATLCRAGSSVLREAGKSNDKKTKVLFALNEQDL